MRILLKEIQRAYIDEIDKQRENERRVRLYHSRTNKGAIAAMSQ
jgi:hypothetical protein